MSNQIETELKRLHAKVDHLTDIVAGPKNGRRFVSAAKAARLMGISRPTFMKKFVDTGKLQKLPNGKFEYKALRNLGVPLVSSGEVCER